MATSWKAILKVIHSNGSIETLEPKGKDGKATLDQLQESVGGLIQQFPCTTPNGVKLWVNEEGVRLKLPYNHKASLLTHSTLFGPLVVEDNRKKNRPEGGWFNEETTL